MSIPISVQPIASGADIDDVYFRRFLDAARSLKCELRIINPKWASEILDSHNSHNRKLSDTWRKIASAIDRDAWQVNGECIVFDADGRLVNGQHRLKAVAQSGKAVPCLVIYGVASEAFATYDQGKKRNASDVLSIDGFEYTTTLAGALAWQMRHDRGQMDTTTERAVPNDMVTKLAIENPGLCESVKHVCGGMSRQRLIPPSLAAFFHYQFGLRDEPLRDTYFEQVIEGVGVVKQSHPFNLRRRLEGDMSGRRSITDMIEIAALAIITWNRMRKNAPPTEYMRWGTNRDGSREFPAII